MKNILSIITFLKLSFDCLSQCSSTVFTSPPETILTAKNFVQRSIIHDDSVYICSRKVDLYWHYRFADTSDFDGIFIAFFKEDSFIKATEVTYKNRLKNGIAKYYYPDGKIYKEENCENGLLDGIVTEWPEGGIKVFENNYQNGKKNGKQFEYYENNQISEEENYIDNKRSGKQFEWYKDGSKKMEALYDENKPIYVLRWRINGFLESYKNFLNGKLNGLSIFWNENGKIKREDYYENGKFIRQVEYWKNGKRKSELECKFKEQKNCIDIYSKEGAWKYYNKKGKLKKIEYYKNNILLETKTF